MTSRAEITTWYAKAYAKASKKATAALTQPGPVVVVSTARSARRRTLAAGCDKPGQRNSPVITRSTQITHLPCGPGWGRTSRQARGPGGETEVRPNPHCAKNHQAPESPSRRVDPRRRVAQPTPRPTRGLPDLRAPSTGMGTLGSPASRSAASPGRPGLDDVTLANTRSPVSRQCPKTCPNVCARTDTRWTQWTR